MVSRLQGTGVKFHWLSTNKFDINAGGMKDILKYIRFFWPKFSPNRTLPLEWNLIYPGGLPASITTGMPLKLNSSGPSFGPLQLIMSPMVEAKDGDPSHVRLEDATVFRIDRVYIACPRWLFCLEASTETL